ncbi:MAG: hypothetical protein IKN81_02785 [Oscillospiraceae bacterium]|nr:hypothetical protein [Oscillospiraceae bacterium]
MLLPGTACDYQTNFAAVLDRLGAKYHLICVNYDGFDGGGAIFPDMITVTEKIERYIKQEHGGHLDGAIIPRWTIFSRRCRRSCPRHIWSV